MSRTTRCITDIALNTAGIPVGFDQGEYRVAIIHVGISDSMRERDGI
jgi:hypothetical protein